MKIKIHKMGGLYIALITVIVFSLLAHFAYNVFGFGNVYYCSYMCWIFLFLYEAIALKARFSRREILITIMLLACFVTGALAEISEHEAGLFEIHRGAFVCLAYASSVAVTQRKLSHEELYGIMRVIAVGGALAGLYALIFQGEYAALVLKKEDVDWNSWFYTSFFSQRNIFGEYCFLATVAGIYNYLVKRNKLYLLLILAMGINIYITNSRGALMAYVCVIAGVVFFQSKNKWGYSLSVLVLLFSFFSLPGVKFFIRGKLSHTTSFNVDSGAIRIMMWKAALKELFSRGKFLIGFGMGAIEDFLFPHYGVGSSHNAYIDSLYDGGMIFIAVLIYAIYGSLKRILHSKDRFYRNTMLATLTAFLLYGGVEAGMTLFYSNFFSVIATLLIIYLPRIYVQNDGLYMVTG